jgi:hypothetical protein
VPEPVHGPPHRGEAQHEVKQHCPAGHCPPLHGWNDEHNLSLMSMHHPGFFTCALWKQPQLKPHGSSGPHWGSLRVQVLQAFPHLP